ncbi:MAG: ABC transporter permease [Anaerolineaceae bacterium]|nr:MAG: ABC transporter permease [Anaerolineaceae bacterium]
MNKVIHVALNDLTISFREKGIWMNLVVIPVLLILLIGFVNGQTVGGGTTQILMDVVNLDVGEDGEPSALADGFLQTIRQTSERIVLCPMDNDADDICALDDATTLSEAAQTERLSAGTVRGTLIIPAGFEAAVLSGSAVDVIYRSDVDPLQPDFLVQNVQVAVQRVGAASVAARVGADAFSTLSDGDAEAFGAAVYTQAEANWAALAETIAFRVNDEDESSSDNIGFRQSVPGMGSMYVMFTVLAGAVLLLQERKQWTLQRLITMPVSRAQVLGGKMTARFAMGMIQYAVAFTFGAMLGVNFGDQIIPLLLLMMSFVLCMTAITFLLGTFIETEMQASGLVTFFVLITAPLGGAWWPLEIVPPFMQTLALLTPIGWAMRGFGELLFYGGGLTDILLPVAVLLGASAVIFALAITRFKYE